MRKQTLFVIALFSVLLAGVGGAIYYRISEDSKSASDESEEVTNNFVPGSSRSENYITDDNKTTSDVYNQEIKNAENTVTDNNSLEVLGEEEANERAQSQAPQAPRLPDPSEFGQYEEYANNSSTLYIDVVPGEGKEVEAGDKVAMVYQGWLTNGELFDQSKLNEDNLIVPFVFTIGSGQVITGWDQGILGMKVGGKRRLIIPSSVGYGPGGQGDIPPNSMLIFDVELAQFVE